MFNSETMLEFSKTDYRNQVNSNIRYFTKLVSPKLIPKNLRKEYRGLNAKTHY